ncbi:MAG TPA: hypothetical protein VK112_01615 [Fodinibius sp.]|nr:hypothetical protein [Fodinibius sp.]
MNNKLKLAGYSFVLLLVIGNYVLAILQLYPELLPSEPPPGMFEQLHNTRNSKSVWISILVIGAYLLGTVFFMYFGKERRSA